MRLLHLWMILGYSWIFACSSPQKAEGPEKTQAEVLFARAEKEFKNENFVQAVELYNELKTKYPYSAHAKDAELRIADAYFEQESFPEAAVSYQAFIQLYPKDARVDYALFQKALSYEKDAPEVIARDQTKSQQAVTTYEEMIAKFPESNYTTKAKDELKRVRKKLAEKEHYVGNFYFIRDLYLSASLRYDKIIEDFHGLGFDEIALYRSGISYARIQQSDKAKSRFRELIEKYPNHPLAKDAQEELKRIN